MFKKQWQLLEEVSSELDAGDAGGVSADIPEAASEVKPEVEVKAYWPEGWRAKWAGEDSKKLNMLSRYTSPEAAFDALIAAQNKIRSGELKTALPKDPKPEELSEWRKENGIPEAPDKYDLKFDSGLVIGEADKPIINGFLETAHKGNLTPDQVKGTVEWYYEEVKRQADERQVKDVQDKQHAADSLNVEWGAEYRRNINMIQGLLSTFPESVRDSIKDARLPDGTGLFNHPDILRGFASMALEVNPVSTLVPSGGGDPVSTVDGEISKIETVMRENRSQYNRDEKMQARYRELLEVREKLRDRAK